MASKEDIKRVFEIVQSDADSLAGSEVGGKPVSSSLGQLNGQWIGDVFHINLRVRHLKEVDEQHKPLDGGKHTKEATKIGKRLLKALGITRDVEGVESGLKREEGGSMAAPSMGTFGKEPEGQHRYYTTWEAAIPQSAFSDAIIQQILEEASLKGEISKKLERLYSRVLPHSNDRHPIFLSFPTKEAAQTAIYELRLALQKRLGSTGTELEAIIPESPRLPPGPDGLPAKATETPDKWEIMIHSRGQRDAFKVLNIILEERLLEEKGLHTSEAKQAILCVFSALKSVGLADQENKSARIKVDQEGNIIARLTLPQKDDREMFQNRLQLLQDTLGTSPDWHMEYNGKGTVTVKKLSREPVDIYLKRMISTFEAAHNTIEEKMAPVLCSTLNIFCRTSGLSVQKEAMMSERGDQCSIEVKTLVNEQKTALTRLLKPLDNRIAIQDTPYNTTMIVLSRMPMRSSPLGDAINLVPMELHTIIDALEAARGTSLAIGGQHRTGAA